MEKGVGKRSLCICQTGTCKTRSWTAYCEHWHHKICQITHDFSYLSRLALIRHRHITTTHFRSLVQIKSHAQKVIKRYDNGEDVFLRLDENMVRTEAVVAQIHDQMKHEGIPIPPAQGGTIVSRKPKMVDVREQIVAASALCQLSQPTPSPLEAGHSFVPTSALPSNSSSIRNIVLGSSSNVVKL